MRSYIVKLAAASKDDRESKFGLSEAVPLSVGVGAGIYGGGLVGNSRLVEKASLNLSGLRKHISDDQYQNGVKKGEKLRLYFQGPEGAKLLDKRQAAFMRLSNASTYGLPVIGGLAGYGAARYLTRKNKD